MPAVVFNSNSLCHPPDRELFGMAGRTSDEFALFSYRSEDELRFNDTDEKPKDGHDHGMDPMRYYFMGVMNYMHYVPIGTHANFGAQQR